MPTYWFRLSLPFRAALVIGICGMSLSAVESDIGKKTVGYFQSDTSRHDFLREYPAVFSLLSSGEEKDRRQKTADDLVKRLQMPVGSIATTYMKECEKLSHDKKADSMDRAYAFFFLGKYELCEELALAAGDAAHRADTRKPSDISSALQLAALAAFERKQNETALKYIKVAQGETDAKNDISTWLKVQSTLAHIYWQSGRAADQILTMRGMHQQCVNTIGEEHSLTLYHHNELAAALFNDRQDAAAELELTKLLPLSEKVAGQDDVKTQAIRKNLAKLLENLDRHPEAESLRVKVVESLKKTLGPSDVNTLKARELLAKNLLEQRKFAECEKETLGLLELCQSVLGAEDAMTLACRSRMLRCRRETSDDAGMEEQWRKLHEEELKALGAEHLETLSTAHELGVLLNAGHKYEEAVKLLKPLLDARIRLLPAEHADTSATRIQLAIAYQNTNQLEKAELEYRNAIKALQTQYGDQHPKTTQVTQRLTNMLNSPEAKTLMISNVREQFTKAEKSYGPNDMRTLNSRLSLANTLKTLTRYAEAEVEFRHIHSSLTRLQDEENSDSIKILREVGNCLNSQEKQAEAEKVYLQVLRTQRRLLQASDPEILQSLYQLGICLGQQSKLAESRAALEECIAGTATAQNINPAFPGQVKNILDQIIQLQRQPPEKTKPDTANTNTGTAK